MRNKDLKHLLHSVDQDTAERVGREYPAVTEEERERIYRRIEARLKPADDAVTYTVPVEQTHITVLRRVSAAAACLLVCGGTLAGLFWVKGNLTPPPEDLGASVGESSDLPQESHSAAVPDLHVENAPVIAFGERAPVPNLVSEGELCVSVMSAGDTNEDGKRMYCVAVALESHGAAPRMGETFLADNFLLLTQAADGTQVYHSPVRAEFPADAAQFDYPYAFTVGEGLSRFVFWYDIGEEIPIALTTGENPSFPQFSVPRS